MLRTFPRATDLTQVKNWLYILREPIPINEITRRKLNTRLRKKEISQEIYEKIVKWKKNSEIFSSDEAEYKYLLELLNLVETRKFQDEIDIYLPLSNEILLGDFLEKNKNYKMYYLTLKGKNLLNLFENKKFNLYENMLFWLILSCYKFRPYLQNLIENLNSYNQDNFTILFSSDYVSQTVLNSWCRYFSIINEKKILDKLTLSKRIFYSTIFELNQAYTKNEEKIPKLGLKIILEEIVNKIENTFRLKVNVFQIDLIISLIYKYTSRDIIRAYKSGRGGRSLIGFNECQILHIENCIPFEVANYINDYEYLKIIRSD